MSYNESFQILTGVAIILSGLCVLSRQYLLEPDSGKYPKAPTWLRVCMLGFAAVQIFVGLQMLIASHHVADPMSLLAVGLFVYNMSMLVNILRQRYPEGVWLRLNKINERLSCGHTTYKSWLIK
jgi:hypothetical protein